MAGRSRLILFAHGSRDPRWCATFEKLAGELAAEVGDDRVRLAFMEFVGPTLDDVVSEAEADGVDALQLLPLFLAGGAHVARDIPAQVEAARARWPRVAIEVLPPVGEDPRFAELLLAIFREKLSTDT